MTSDMWHGTCDMRHVTHDRWYVTFDTWWEVKILSKVQVPSSNNLGVMMVWRFGGKGSINEWINEWMNNKCVCITTPATPGLLKIASLVQKLEWCKVEGCKICEFCKGWSENGDGLIQTRLPCRVKKKNYSCLKKILGK